jgi:uncharacterized membrane protein
VRSELVNFYITIGQIVLEIDMNSSASKRAVRDKLSHARRLHMFAIMLSVIGFAVLVVSFSLAWQAVYQVAAALICLGCIEWQLYTGRKMKELDVSSDRTTQKSRPAH